MEIYSYDEVSSTNDVAKKMINILKNGDIVWALSQTAGRGKGERKWYSPKGGLWFSVVYKPQKLCEDPNIYTKMASVAVVKILKRMKIKNVGVKWPNDIYHNRDKLGGILTEIFTKSHENVVIIGIGLNVNNMPPENVENATSLFKITGVNLSLSQLLKMISAEMQRLYNFITLRKRNVITNLWRNNMIVKKGHTIKVSDFSGKTYEAKVVKVLSDSLIVERNGIKERIHPSEISI
ncbi:biotin--[acetyl-CoA-carboxylase] ligase [Mesoaciditoga sp.]